MSGFLKYIFLFVVIFMFSCNSPVEKKEKNNEELAAVIEDDTLKAEIKKNSDITIPNYTIIETKSDHTNGDYANSFTIKFDSINFQSIISQIKKSKYYIDILDPSIPPNIVLKEEKIKRWSKAKFGYRFEYFIDGTDKILEYEVDLSDYTLYSLYIEE